MNGLRVYVNAEITEACSGQAVFYSKRAHGPFYRWSYEGEAGRWHSARMHADKSPPELSVTPWKSLPELLKARLIDHYLE